jgi:hypothetical protein
MSSAFVRPWRLRPEWPELSDLVFDVDPADLSRRPVDRDAVIARLQAVGNDVGAQILADLPHRDGRFDPEAVDRLLVASHREIQRLALEMQQGPRMARLVRAALSAVRARDPGAPLVVVDVVAAPTPEVALLAVLVVGTAYATGRWIDRAGARFER